MSATVNANLNRCFMRFEDRAERFDNKQIIETFVSVGPLLDILANKSHQIIYGRRGVGKTHALKYFESQAKNSGDIAIYVDCQNIGSNQSIYDDKDLPISERATRLLIDVCSAMHWAFLDTFTDASRGWSLADVAPLLDDFTNAISQIRIDGSYEVEARVTEARKTGASSSLGLAIKEKPEFTAGYSSTNNEESSEEVKNRHSGVERSSIDFNFIMQNMRKIVNFVAPRRIWLLVDEWSTVPPDIQPYLADLIRRSFFTIPNFSIKIAAIEQRSKFKIDFHDERYIGVELGADISVALNLDDYLVFDSNEQRSIEFFRNLVNRHMRAISRENSIDIGVPDGASVTGYAFTQENVFIEFVKASEGVPRDAMHILTAAAQKAAVSPISMPIMRQAALQFFQSDKYNAISANPENRRMLDWIRHQVIGERRTRAFLLPVGAEDEVIDRLFDRRALHILNRNMSAAHLPGARFVVYKIDYGCYVDMINTDKFPSGMLFRDDQMTQALLDVPDDDARSYRRAILDLSEFYKTNPDIRARRDGSQGHE
ncbi:hypothetical protein GXW74_24675 [Roseomonas eburnea]|uniref:Uncharacterized protein n=1 Tax=Neoroseomonas eburnea TaxID=1346889 RepID=A0A9X9XJ11_9PROT|nr:hypothetical protein [Neoroseomonas eburnea]MBR0683697.1 hypothetical protein [Neoroseomonas eburnea]